MKQWVISMKQFNTKYSIFSKEGALALVVEVASCALVIGSLKLLGYITWSWWWVLMPIWIYITILTVLLAFLIFMKLNYDN